VKHTFGSTRADPTTTLIERAAPELGQSGHVHRAQAIASNSPACVTPKTTTDTGPAILGQNVDHIDFNLCVDACLPSFTTTDETDDRSLGLRDEIHALRVYEARR
jgi:hypothetical protein